jgi:hypothetical protein
MHMPDTMFDLGRRHTELCNVDPVVKLARAREQALEAWGEAQEEADRIVAALPREARGDPKIEETSGYAAAYERTMRLLEPVLEIEGRLEETMATTPAGLLIQARLLEAALPSSGHGGGRLLASIIAGLGGDARSDKRRLIPRATLQRLWFSARTHLKRSTTAPGFAQTTIGLRPGQSAPRSGRRRPV